MSLNPGDGKLLRTDGPQITVYSDSPLNTVIDVQATADRRLASAACTACHPYKAHGLTEPLGCFACHSAHVYKATGEPNYYVLRNTVTTATFGTKTDVSYTVLGLPSGAAGTWVNAGTNGYCEKCHGSLSSWPTDIRTHTIGDNCATCHVHNKAGALRSFEASGCDGCHGSPPAVNVETTGYAVGYTPFKDESLTPHASHSGAASGYVFACAFCHNNNDFNATHNKGTFQNVLDGTTFQLAVKPANFAATPSYTTTGAGTCNNVACHSNGGRRTGDSTNVFIVTAPTWQDGTITNPITTCNACHGNDATTMNSSNKYNSVSHIKHLDAGYTCNICHSTTAASNDALTGTAAGTTHVNGLKNVAFSGIAAGGNYTQASGTCTVICHGSTTPDWDLPATGACGTCHQYSNAGTSWVATGTGTPLSATHNKHVTAAGNGVQETCDTCHTNNGPGAGTGHADGSFSYVADYQNAVCNPCHGATALNSGNDLWPVWGNSSTVKCEICHLGTLARINLRWAPAKTSFTTTGHGSVAAFNTANPVDPCKACHTTTATHFNGPDNSMLTGGAATDSAFCLTCHNSTNFKIHSAAANGSSAGDSCLICHESHGEGMGTNAGVMLTKGSGYTDGSTRASFANASGTGVCQTCHSSSIAHFNNLPTDETATHQGAGNCTTCHTHDKTPAFMYSAGTACNQCHDFPPATGAHRTGPTLADDELHSSTSKIDDTEDRSDCAKCHTGADLYTYDPVADRVASLNHGQGADAAARRTNRLLVLASPVTSIGYNSTDNTCSNACHTSTVANGGAWFATTGLDCNSCHYYAANPTSAGNTLTGSHGKHFGTGSVTTCTDCHTVDNGGTALSGQLTHVTTPLTGTDLEKIQGRAAALQDEATVKPAALGTGSDPDPGNATCNNGACHNPSNGAFTATWTVANVAGCAFCHSATDPGAGSHDEHMGAATTFGINTVACTSCHANNGTNNAHRNGTVTFAAGMNYTGGAEDVGGTVGSCNTTTCHNDGTVAATAVDTPTWGTASANCTICHGNAPANGTHSTHISGAKGPQSGTVCNTCHQSNANNTSMAGMTAHINGSVQFADGNALTTTARCNTCHGGSAAAVTAKANWTTSAPVACESCHSTTPANSQADGGGVIAPERAGGAYTNFGHGRTGTGKPGKACADCHNENSSHISGTLNDNNRLNIVLTKDYALDPDGFCTVCHEAATVEHIHKSNGVGGLSTSGDQCNICHEPHGTGGMDAMIRSSIGGKTVAGFTDRAVRTSYYLDPVNSGINAGQYGICQVCHDPADPTADASTITYFNFDTATPAHYSGLCIGCHKHADTPAFKPSGCSGCHGDSVAGNFWPDAGAYPDRSGLHPAHVDAIAVKMTGGATLDNKNATCLYCHPNPGGTNVNGAGHDVNSTGSPVDISDLHKDGWNPATSYYNLQGALDTDGAYYPTIKRCSIVDCHSNGEFTWTWYPDVLAPAPVTNLAAATGTEPGTADLTWTAPANDGAAGPNAYHYEVRYSTGPITEANWASATIAGGPPSVGRRGKVDAAKMKVDGLTGGNTYYFAVKTADEVDNWSMASNSISAVAKTDTLAPVFLGLGQSHSTDETGTVVLSWEAAQDHSLPVTYTVYYDTGTIEYSAVTDTAITTTGTTLKVSGLPTGVLYHFAVRAKDSVDNSDANLIVRTVLPTTTAKIQPTTVTYYTSGTTTLQTGTYGTTGSGNATFRTANFTADTNVVGTSFYAKFSNGSETVGGTVTADLGYWNGAFNAFTPAVTVTKTVPPNTSNKVLRLGFGAGGMVPAGSGLALRITVTGATVSYGSAANRGDITVLQTPYNHLPSAFTFATPPNGNGIVNIFWNAATDTDGHLVHYDVVGSDDNGVTFKHVIAEGLTGTPTVSVTWNTLKAGIGLSAANTGVVVKVLAMDGYQKGDGSGAVHTALTSAAWTVNNSVDTIAPGQIKDLVAETRPKSGTAYLTWTAPGDDGYDKTRAAQYDIRYAMAAITNDTEYNLATQVTSKPVPTFGGTVQGYEVLNLTPDIPYYFAIKAADEVGNWSTLSDSDPVTVGTQSPSAKGGQKCGICHGTPPDDATTAGNHLDHGYTVPDCMKCHGDEVATYGIKDYNFQIRHQDGLLQLGWGRDATGAKLPQVTGVFAGSTLTYTQSGFKIYEDTSSGGFTLSPTGDQIDNGTCFNFATTNASGCHGPATPSWDENLPLPCAACHGDILRTNDAYGQPYDNAGNEEILASPPVDNHGNSTGKYVGQHEKHLNYSFRYAKGDNCRLCHKDNVHADGNVDVAYDSDAAGTGALFTRNATGPNTPGTCGGTSVYTCHGTAATPAWDSAEVVDCVGCHGFNGSTPAHVTDPAGGVTLTNNGWATDPMPGNCTYCHPAGHPSGTPADTVLIPNNSFVGINYSGGGIHLRTNIGGRGPFSSEAEMCWGCHDTNGISEWGANNKALTGGSPYNYGTVNSGTSAKWIASPGVGASWSSGKAAFAYKTGAIQSTHSTSPAGSSAVILNTAVTPKRYQENVDAVATIHCTNCHDVHDMNRATGDTATGSPYLRGTWMGNPYEEDGAPQVGKVYTGQTYSISHTYAASTIGFGPVPRGGIKYTELGGYYIDQNNVVPGTGESTRTPATNPTAAWTLQGSAGLCTLCHGDNVDALDQQTAENLWLGSNGHSNSVLGSTGVYAANIFDYTHGRPVPSTNTTLSSEGFSNRVPNMGNQRGAEVAGDQYFIYGYRLKTWNPQTHSLNNEPIDALAYDWGASVDAGTTDKMYHQFSCSKCHNPHASRLPKLMITNCLDIVHNTWDDNKNSQTRSTASTTDANKKPAYYASAQTCHRRDSSRNAANFDDPINGGWTKVTPW